MKASLLLVILTFVLACTAASAADRLFEVTGVIRGHLDDGQVVIQHEAIPDYMPAMTMAFTLGDPADATKLKNGDRVHFRFRVGEESSRAESFSIVGHETTPVAANPAPAKGNRLRVGDAVPEFALLDENEVPLSAAALRGKLTVVTFIFTRCPVPEYCPAMALRFGSLQKTVQADPKLAGRARLLSVTLDPEFDRPEILKAYGQAIGADSAVWSFATGSKETIAALTKAFAVYTERNGATLDHALTTALIGTDGRIVELWRGNGWKVSELLDVLYQEAAKTAVTPCCGTAK